MLSPTLGQLFSDSICNLPTIFLPEISTFSVQSLFILAQTGILDDTGPSFSSESINEITETAQLLGLDTPNFFVEEAIEKPKTEYQTEIKVETNVLEDKMLTIAAEPTSPMALRPLKKSKKVEYQQNSDGAYSCLQCNYQPQKSSLLRRHVESIHEGVRYNCNQCDHKATDRVTI